MAPSTTHYRTVPSTVTGGTSLSTSPVPVGLGPDPTHVYTRNPLRTDTRRASFVPVSCGPSIPSLDIAFVYRD